MARQPKPLPQYRVVIHDGACTLWRFPRAATSSRHAAEYAARTLNAYLRETGAAGVAIVDYDEVTP
jgi:hypothetical protein